MRGRACPASLDSGGHPVHWPLRFLGQGAAIDDAGGATRTFPTPLCPPTPNLGTNRMSDKAADGAVDRHGETHDAPRPSRCCRAP